TGPAPIEPPVDPPPSPTPPPAEPKPTRADAKEKEAAAEVPEWRYRASRVGIGPGLVYRAPLNDIAPALSFIVRSGVQVTPNVALSGVVNMSIYDFEGIGNAYKWLFAKDSPQIAGAIFLMWFIPFWYSHNYM